MQQLRGAGGGASGSSCCLRSPRLCSIPPSAAPSPDPSVGGQMMPVGSEERCCLRRGREGGGGFCGPAWLKPMSQEKAQPSLPPFLCGLAAGIVDGAKGVVVWGVDRVRMRAASRGWELDEKVEGRRGGSVCW